MNSKERCLATIKGEKTDRVPVFPLLMFFSQRRLGVTYREFATDGHITAEAQLKIRDNFPIDAITACTDAFRVSADLGGEMEYPEDKPPHLAKPIVTSEADLKKLGKPDPTKKGSRMADRAIAVSDMAKAFGADCLVLGWVDMPFAEACSLCGISEFMVMLYDNPSLAHKVLEFETGIVVDFALSQLKAGAHMIGAGDAATSLISDELYREFALPYEKRVNDAIHNAGGLSKLHVCGNTSHLIKDMVKSGADLFNVDHLVDLEDAKKVYSGAKLCFKGNLDPVSNLLQSSPEQCLRKCKECLELTKGSQYMLSAGCEIPADTKDEVFEAFCESVN